MKKEKTKIITLSISALVILVSIIGYTYSYFSASVNYTNKTETIVKTNELNITYTGGQEIDAGNMIPGDSFTKTFTVENTSSKAVTFNIYMENIINEFNEDLVYSISDESGIFLNQRVLPVTNEGKSYLKANVQIEANTTKNYTLTIMYKYLYNINQSESQGSTFSAIVGIDTVQNVVVGEKGVLIATSENNTEAFWGQRENITKVVFENELVPKENAAYSYDVSEGQDKSVMSYLMTNEENPNTYTLYLQGEGNIKANEDSRYLFKKFTNLKTIEGLENFDTSKAVFMFGVFELCINLTSLDVSHFDTSNVIDMTVMFAYCSKLTNIQGLENFDTKKVVSMWQMFSNCTNLTSLNLSHFDTSNVTNMNTMFVNCNNLTNLDLSNFNTTNVSNMIGMFRGCSKLTNLNIANFDMNNVTEYGNMFSSMPDSALIYVKDEFTRNKILSSLNCPSWTVDNIVIAS